MIELNVDGFNTMPDGTCRTIKNQYQKNSVANFTSQGDRGATAACVKIGNVHPSGKGMSGEVYDSNGLSATLTANKGQGQNIAIPVLTPDRVEKRQNGRRFKEDGEPSFTLTAQDRHGVGIEVEPKGIIGGMQEHQSHREDGIVPCLTSSMGTGGGYVPMVEQKVKVKEATKQGYAECRVGGGWTVSIWLSLTLKQEEAEFNRIWLTHLTQAAIKEFLFKSATNLQFMQFGMKSINAI